MAFAVDDLLKKLNKCLIEHFHSQLNKQLDLEIKTMGQIVSCIEGFYSTQSNIQPNQKDKASFRTRLLKIVDEAWQRPAPQPIIEIHSEFWEELITLIDELPKYAAEEQKVERFHSVDTDSTFIKVIKAGKNSLFRINSLPNAIANIFRKEKKTNPYWIHDIPLRNLAKKNFVLPIVPALQKISELYYATISAQYLELKQWEESLTQNNGTNKTYDDSYFNAFKENLINDSKHQLSTLFAPLGDQFLIEYDQAGTIELPESVLTDELINGKIENALKNWSLSDLEWRNTNFALFEEWRLDIHIHLLENYSRASLEDFQSAQFKKIDDYIGPEMDAINSFIDEGITSIEKDHESIQKEFKRLNYQAEKKLDKEIVPLLCEKLSNQKLINLINKLEVNISQQVEELSDERVIVKTDSYDTRIKTDDLNHISPYELISFETLSKFRAEITQIKQKSYQSLEKTAEDVKDLDHIITFSLSSAIATLENQGNEEEAISIATEGLKRAALRLEEERSALNESIIQCSNDLELAIEEFCKNIIELTSNENVRQLRLRITKAKATEQAKAMRLRLEEQMVSRKKRIFLWSLSTFNDIRHQLIEWSDRFILTARKPQITKQVADFLLESQQAIDKLPLIYKRLYQIEPLEDLELFEGRQEELLTLKKAFDSWQKGHFSATVVMGEKWSGLTSFLTYGIHKHNFSFSITRMAVQDNGYSHDDLVHLMQKVLDNENLNDIEAIIQHLNDSPKRVVILEDIQNMYQRKIHGFKALQLLFQIINRTYKNVYWVVSANIYAWSYLKKTINIDEYFSYFIELKSMSNDQIVNVIWKRNRISGFKIQFEVDSHLQDDKKFNKLSAADQQLWLKKKFFSELTSFAQSNVSLALIYWLLATKDVDESTITIGTFKKPNLNFLSVLAMNKLYALHALILHDGLSQRQLAEVLNTTESSSGLTLLALLEDGIILLEDNQYMVNPIVYRNTISLLKSRNLIH